MPAPKSLRVTLIKSFYGHLKAHRACVRGLGLRRIRDVRVVPDTPENRGMIHRATHLLKVEEA